MRIIIVNTYSLSRSTGLIAYALLNYLRGNGHTVKLCCRGHEDTYKDDPDIIRLNTRGATYSAALLTCLTGIEGRYNIQGTNKLLKLINDCAGLNETLPEDWPLKVHDNSVGEYCHILTHIEEFDKVALGNIAHDYAQKFSITNMQSQYEELYN